MPMPPVEPKTAWDPNKAAPDRREINRIGRLLIAEWERVENKRVNVSYVATFADMARVVIADRRPTLPPDWTWPDVFDLESARATADVSSEEPPNQESVDALVVELRWACDEVQRLRAENERLKSDIADQQTSDAAMRAYNHALETVDVEMKP